MKAASAFFTCVFCAVLAGCGAIGGGGGIGGKNLTQPVTGLTAAPGNAEVTLNWNAYPFKTFRHIA